MKKRGFSLVELIIAMGLLSIILSAVATLFTIGIKNYRRESLRNFMQKEINFSSDDIGNQIKQSAISPDSYSTYVRSANTLVLALPAISSNQEFVYSGSNLIYDHLIYSWTDSTLYKKVIPDPSSARTAKDEPILGNVNQFNCVYTPTTDTDMISCVIGTQATVDNNTLEFSATKTARLRNHR